MKVTEINIPNKPIQPEAQDTTMAQNQLLKIGQQAIKIENMIANNQEISEWASNKINLVSEYVKKVHGYIQNEKAPPGREDQVKALKGKFKDKGAPYAIAWSQHNKHGKPKNEAPIEQDHNNPVAKPYVDMPEWKALHDMDDKIIDAYIKHKEVKEDGMTPADVDRVKNQHFTTKQIKHAYRVLNHPSVKGGNYTAAYNIINRIAPGLADHPDVANALKRANEMQEMRGSSLAVRTISNYADELGPESMDYDMLKKSAEMLEKGELEELGKFLHDSDTSPREYVMKVISKKDPDTFKQMYGDQEGYMSLMKPKGMEGLKEEQSVRVKTDVHGEWGGHLGKVLDKDDDENWLVGFGNEAEWFKQDDLEFLDDEYVNDPDTDGEVATLDPEFEEDAGTSPLKETVRMVIELVELLKNGGSIDESTQNILNQAADNLHGVYHYESYANTNRYREELDSNILNKHAGVIQKGIDHILATETPIDDIDTKPGMLRILSKRVNEVEKEMAKEVRENMQYEDMLMNKLDSAMQEYDTPEKKAQRDALMKKYLAKGGKIEKVPTGKTAYKNKELKPAYRKDNGTPITSPGSDESVKEDAPFDGMGLVRMALMRKFITAQEWHGLQHKWKDAVEELEQRYDDWPEDQGFGSSDHSYAIKELMELVGYEFDDQDTSGRFVVSKMPPELEKLGIKNTRMRDAVATEERQEGFAVRYSLDGKRKAQAYRSEKDAQHRAEILRSMGGVKDVSITKHTFNFKKESAYESKLARMLNQQLK